uniref:Uncharacterized protein n=1 Tax=Magallana gigas TaxID=29159 RepID=A0A8W8HKR2_MAGGI
MTDDESAMEEHTRRLFTNRESLTILRLCSSIISGPEGVSASVVMSALHSEEEGRELINRVRTLHPDSYRKIITDRSSEDKDGTKVSHWKLWAAYYKKKIKDVAKKYLGMNSPTLRPYLQGNIWRY